MTHTLNIQTGDIDIQIIEDSDMVALSFRREGHWENHMRHLWTLFTQKNRDQPLVVYDIGAYTGVYSIIAAKNPNNIVYAFEPLPQIRKRLFENIKLNSVNVTIKDCAAGNSNTKTELLVTNSIPLPSGSSICETGKTIKYKVPIDVVRVDSIDIIPDMVKIDVEGFELEVLMGFGDLLKTRPVVFVEILSENNKLLVIDLMQKFGYTEMYLIDDLNQTLLSVSSKIAKGRTNFLFYSGELP